MNIRTLSAAIVALSLSACMQITKTVAPSSPPPVIAQTPSLPPPVESAPAVDAAAIAVAERDLKALGYSAGKSGDINDFTLRHAIAAFEKDQGLPEDGQLSAALEGRLKQLHFVLLRKNRAPDSRNTLFVFSDGTVRNTAVDMLPPIPAGLASDAPPDLLRPMRPGTEAIYHLGHRTKAVGFAASKSVSCRTGHMIRANTVFGEADVLALDCQIEGEAAGAWHCLYSPTLDFVVEQDSGGKSRTLVAMRPSTANWPPAARTGLDWAITHALDSPASDTPIQWSSTGITAHFEIRALGRISGQELGLAGKYAGASCRRFELTGNGHPPSHYPGIACRNANGTWTFAGTGLALSSPAKAMRIRTVPPNLKSAQNP